MYKMKSRISVVIVMTMYAFVRCKESGKFFGHRRKQHQCVPIQEPRCAEFGYNATIMPSILGHDTQEEASVRFNEFTPLMEWPCSPHVHFFLCSLHFPICTSQVEVSIPACRAMCDQVKADCEPFMLKFGLGWPVSIDCAKLPAHNESQRLCMQPPTFVTSRQYVGGGDDDVTTPRRRQPVFDQVFPPVAVGGDDAAMTSYDDDDDVTRTELDAAYARANADRWTRTRTNKGGSSHPVQINHFALPDVPDAADDDDDVITTPGHVCRNPRKFYFLRSARKCVERCGQDMDVMYSGADKRFVYLLLSVCSIVCLVTTTATVCTFAIDTRRFRYPERPIAFIALCYLLFSLGHVFRAAFPLALTCASSGESDTLFVAQGGFASTGCTAVFVVTYYFGMAASAWWVVLSVVWFLSAGLKWGHEALEVYGFYFHIAAWGFPAVQTFCALVTSKIDADELTGMCYVGNTSPDTLMYFVIIPSTFYLLAGAVTMTTGMAYMCKISSAIRRQQDKQGAKVAKLLLRLCTFSLLYIAPASCVIAVDFYRFRHTVAWRSEARDSLCAAPARRHDDDDYNGGGGETARRRDGETSWYAQARAYAARWPEYGESRDRRSADGEMSRCEMSRSIPAPMWLFAMKLVMSLVTGVACSMWICSRKTLRSWSNFYSVCSWSKERDESRLKATKPGVERKAAVVARRPSPHHRGSTSSEIERIMTSSRKPTTSSAPPDFDSSDSLIGRGARRCAATRARDAIGCDRCHVTTTANRARETRKVRRKPRAERHVTSRSDFYFNP